MNEGGLHKDEGKSMVTAIPPGFLLEMGAVFAISESKYPLLDSGKPNYCAGIRYTRLIGSALRHILNFSLGEDTDPETGFTHLAHAGCCLAMLWHMWIFRPDLDDRINS